jgi:radical SAM superfamily enzyme YgiQ (UPF0313 family)
MKVLLISANTETITMPTLPLGLACVAAATQQAGHDVSVVDLMMEKDAQAILKGAIEGFDPDLIGISVRNIDDQNREHPRFLLDPVKEIVAVCRRFSEARIVLGGAGYSIFPEAALSYLGADMGIQGEGEVIFPALIERIEQGAGLQDVPGLYLPSYGLQGERVFEKNLDQLPLPGTEHLGMPFLKKGLWLPVQTRRGCPLNCSYCSTGMIEGQMLRRHSPETIIGWIAQWRKAGVHQFFFVDNTFNLPPSYGKELCRRLIDQDLGIKWSSIVYPKYVDHRLADAMARAGRKQVSIGFESGSEKMLKGMNKRFTLQEVRHISEVVSTQGIKRMGFLLLGGPGETRATVEESLVFADSLNLDSLKISAGVRIYPGTPLAKQAIEKGMVASPRELLFPRFYLEEGLGDWLRDNLKQWASIRSHWIIPETVA